MSRSHVHLVRRLLAGLLLWLPMVAATAGELAKAPTAQAERRIALVIGNARYPAMPLRNPENDAQLMSANLRKLGFEVNLQLNLGVLEFRRTLREFARRLQDEDVVAVLYYAGHGVQIDGRNFLLPIDINLRDREEVKDESVDIDEAFLSRLDNVRSKARIVILDACRDNPFAGKTRNIRASGGLAEMAARGTLIAYASAPGAPAEDGPSGKNSVYTSNLAREMMVPNVEVEQMFKNVRVGVLRDTKDRQVPWVNTSLTSNFSFNPAQPPVSDAQAKAQEAQAAQAARLRQLEAELEEARRQLKVMGAAGPAQKTAAPLPGAASAPGAGQATSPAPSVATAPASSPAATAKAPAQSAAAQVANLARIKRIELEREQAKKDLEAANQAIEKSRKPDDGARAAVRLATTKPEPADMAGAAGGRRSVASGNQARCRELLARLSIGDALSSTESSFLKQECK